MSRERKILEVAAKLFSERGFSAVGVDEIGRRAGITGPAIYRHFRGKDEILESLFDEALDGLTEATAVGGGGEDPLRAIVRGHAAYVLRAREHTHVWSNESHSLSVAARSRLRRRTRAYIDRWTAAVHDSWPERSPDEVEASVQAALALVNAPSRWPAALREQAGLLDMLTDMALGALAAGRRHEAVAA